jgi:hypothetical protein
VSNDENRKPAEAQPARRKPYEPPVLRRWGSLKELTRGGAGRAAEPGIDGAKKTRF